VSSSPTSTKGKQKLKSARGRTASSQRWLERQLADPYVRAAKAAGYRSRAAFKLIELDDKFGLLKGARRIVDLGAAPGGWCQIAAKRAPAAHVVAIDLLAFDPLPGVVFLQRNFLDEDVPALLEAELGGPADLVMSDMAANTTGHKQTDHLRTMGLCEAAVDFACLVLRPGGGFVAKVLAGGADRALLTTLQKRFASVKHVKPPASRKDSSEWYVVATGFRPESLS
jgi:23S rRNA (uridine2552-2'-O)-methyltransferase